MRTARRQSSSKYLVKTEKPMQIQNEHGESGKLFGLCETLLLLFSWKILLNKFNHFGGYPVPVELKQPIPSLSQMSPGLRECLQRHNQPRSSWALREGPRRRHCPRCEQSVVGQGMKPELQTAAAGMEHRRGSGESSCRKPRGEHGCAAMLPAAATNWSCWEAQDHRELQGANPHGGKILEGRGKYFFEGNGHHRANLSLWEWG